VGDVNSDGNPDLIVAGGFANSVFVLAGNGDGTFRSPVGYPVGTFPNGRVVVSDFNSDGKPDIAVACQSSGSLSVLINRGDGAFQAAVNYAGFGNAFSVIAADFNNDGKVDLAVAAGTTSPVLLGNGDGTFVRAAASASSFSHGGIAAGDLNSDGKIDLVNAGLFFSGNGNGTFSTGISYGGDGLWPSLGDFNGDGKLDVVARLRTSDPNAPGAALALGNPNGTFQPAVTFEAGGTFGWASTAADLRGIGVFDAIMTADITPPLSVLLGQQGGTLARRVNYGVFNAGGPGSPAAVGDFNRDGNLDIAASQGGSIGVMLGRGDGTFSAPQMLVLSNTSNTIVSVSAATITGPNASEFSVNYNNCSNGIGNSVRQCYIGVSFAPASAGGKSAVLTLSDTAGGQFQVTLSGEGIPVKTNTATAVSVSPNPTAYRRAVTVTATVSPSAATGSVQFFDGVTAIGTATLTSGTAPMITPGLAVGSHSVTAVYSGDGGYNGSTSTAILVTINKADTSAVVSSSANPAVSGDNILFSATVSPLGATGTVQFLNGGVPFVSGPLGAGDNTIFSGRRLPAGTYTITAVYSGDGNYNGSTSTAYIQVVAAATTAANTTASFTEEPTTVTTSFTSVSISGNTTVTPIDPNAGGSIPGGFVLLGSGFAFDVTTTAGFNGPVTTCFVVPSIDPVVFPFIRILHNENGTLIDRTILSGPNAPNLSTRTICASTLSLSPFVLATVTDLVAPAVTNVTLTPNPVPVGAPLTLTASLTDTATGNSRIASAEYSVDGGATWQPITASYYTSAVLDVSASLPGFTAAAVQNVCVRATDAARNIGTSCAFLAVYDPNGAFITGGGWIASPAGAYAANPALVGRANFGFVSKYQPGANFPSGQTQFEFQTANLNFHSTTYEWLVVAGARGQFKGSGTINRAGDYGFLLTAIDGQVPGGGEVDKFRIKIIDKQSDAVVYDNQIGASDTSDSATALGGGSILIRK
jgi:hypothetical protein